MLLRSSNHSAVPLSQVRLANQSYVMEYTKNTTCIDGNTPSTISQSAVDTAAGSSNQGNGASILLASGLGVSALTVVSTIMAFF